MAARALESLCAEAEQAVVFDEMKQLEADVERPEARAPEPERVLDGGGDGEDAVAAEIGERLHRAVGEHRPALDALDVVQQTCRRRPSVQDRSST